MAIKLAVLQSGDQIIADMKEIVSEERPIAYLFNKPHKVNICLLYTSPSPRDATLSRMPSSA